MIVFKTLEALSENQINFLWNLPNQAINNIFIVNIYFSKKEILIFNYFIFLIKLTKEGIASVEEKVKMTSYGFVNYITK